MSQEDVGSCPISGHFRPASPCSPRQIGGGSSVDGKACVEKLVCQLLIV